MDWTMDWTIIAYYTLFSYIIPSTRAIILDDTDTDTKKTYRSEVQTLNKEVDGVAE